uniref:MBD domain-containing protein n=2 Tax=Brassica oleracea var. oleracea TaxID=109376 RepID=A0A0D3BW54_BRAOL
MVITTSSSTILIGEEGVEIRPSEESTPTHSHRRRWSTPIESGVESLDERLTFRSLTDHEGTDHRGADDFYLGGEISAWGPFGPPLLKESRPIAPPQMPLPKRTEAVVELRRERSVTRKRDLPPYLTTLDCNGRPRFHHRRVRSEGRLEIASVAVSIPEIVSVRGREGLRIGTCPQEGFFERVRERDFLVLGKEKENNKKEAEDFSLILPNKQMEEEELGNAVTPRAKKDVAPGRVVDTYAAQCDTCHKWRVIDSQEEYEDIRSRVLEDPFTCDKKKQVSCEDPADLDYDSSRTWVIDKPGIPKTPKGFKRSLVLRKDYSKMDTYYITPAGKKLRSRNEVASFIETNPEFKDAPLRDFTFTVPKVMEDTCPPDAKLASPAVTTTDDVSEKSFKPNPFKG